ncbi:hypothetical protein [Helicobacter zhangjianzhongii]|uniref:Uncharacterized protein n=1 Tax=Helicobacter zhangjianzhongii TaxID=2974574 RepID=A0ACC6FRV3_9HELI|nr:MULTISPECIES: hypothetical protein [unclassified Helicobacter]MDL0080140.1 hypothetical protein [Helicobacter sp. CPD2-1]MDL0081929.1 hypothetical protein [Helicobacter sp. XJK30-2]
MDSNLEAENVKNSAQDSRICDEKSLLCEPRKEIRLGCLSTQRGDAIKDLSRKAESTNQATPKPALGH